MRSLWKSAWRRIGSRSLATEVTVKHLPFAATSDSVGDLFATLKLPAPQKIEVALTTENKRPKGWAYVSYDNDAEAATAIQTLSGHTYEGRRLQVIDGVFCCGAKCTPLYRHVLLLAGTTAGRPPTCRRKKEKSGIQGKGCEW